MADSHKRCPEPEVLAAYADRGLSLAESARVDQHLASCPQCIALVAGVVRTVAEVPESTPHAEPAVEIASRAATRRTLVGVLAAAAAVIAILSGPSLLRPWLDGDAELVNLVGVGEQRSVLGRLTGGFPHSPPGVPSAGGQGGRAVETDRLLLAAAKIRESFGKRETPLHLHDLGVSQLLAGELDAAAGALLAASREHPANARYLSDVAAVQLERARRGLRPDDLPRALDSADRARRLDPSLNEAWFNRALAYTALSLTDHAKAAWADYLDRDAQSPWAVEARARLAELSERTPAAAWTAIEQRLNGPIDAALADEAVRAQTTEARSELDNVLLPAWASAVRSGRHGAAELTRVRTMAAAYLRVAGDGLYVDAVSAIDRAEARGPAAVAELARAHAAYAAATSLYTDDRFSDSAPGLTAAREGFTAAGSPFASRPALDLSTILYVGGKADEALAILQDISETADHAGYAYNSARSAWIKGLIAFGQGRLADAQTFYEQTLSGFERMGDAEQTANAHSLLAAFHHYLGNPTTAWRHRLAAFEGLKVSQSRRFKHALMASSASAVYQESPETALSLQDQALANAREWKREAAIAELLAQRAATLLTLGRSREAGSDLAEARRRLPAIPDAAFRSRVEVSILGSESDLYRVSEPAASVAAARRAIALVEQRRDRLRLAQLHLRLAKSNIVVGNLRAAEAALGLGIQAFEDERATLSDEGRISTLDESWQLFETAVHLAIKNKDYPRAFALAERGRARTLAESRQAEPARTLESVAASLQPNEALFALNQFDTELAVWVIRRDRTTVTTRPLTRRDAEKLVARQQDEIRFEAAVPNASADLYNEIIRPVIRQLDGVSRLAVVSDATFANAAFAAFWDPSARQFLVERLQLNVTPSASAFVAAKDRAVEPGDDTLILAGPGERADRDARAVAAAYPNPELLTGPAATRSRFLAQAAERAIIHVAAPTVENRAYPLLSQLLLADETNRPNSGALLGRDIVARAMNRTRLVVIDSQPTDGGSSITRAFLTAGTPAVLTTLPGTTEQATRELMVGFHRLMATGITADAALNQLQRNELQKNGRRVGAWSALVLYGSDR